MPRFTCMISRVLIFFYSFSADIFADLQQKTVYWKELQWKCGTFRDIFEDIIFSMCWILRKFSGFFESQPGVIKSSGFFDYDRCFFNVHFLKFFAVLNVININPLLFVICVSCVLCSHFRAKKVLPILSCHANLNLSVVLTST